MDIEKLSISAFIAGILIGLGVIINTLSTIPILGATLFSFGLLTIIALQLSLFTGKIGFAFSMKCKSDLLVILWNNLMGVAICVIAYYIANPSFGEKLINAASIKFTKTYLQMLIYGIFCGSLIHFAIKTKDKPYLTSMSVILFILMGAEHCVADFPYLITCFNINNLLKFILVIIGNSIGAILLEEGLKNTNEVCGLK